MTIDPWHLVVVLLATVVVVEGIAIVGVMRQIGGIYLQVGPPRPGQTPGHGPEDGDTVDPVVLGLDGQPAIVFFLDPTCSVCPAVAKAIPIAQAHYRGVDFIPAVVGPATDEKLAYAAALGQRSRTDLDRLYEEWKVAGTPYAIGFAADGVVRISGVVNSLPQIETMAQTLIVDAQENERRLAAALELEEAL